MNNPVYVLIPVWGAQRTKGLTWSRRKKAGTLADTEEKYLTHDEEFEAERKKEKTNNRKAVSRLEAGLRRQADEDFWTFRDVNMEEARIIGEQNIRRRAEWRADDTGRTHSNSRK